MKHRGTEELNTGRLLLRRFTLKDADAVFTNYASEDEVTKYLRWKPHKNVFETESLLSDWIDRYSDNTFYNWAIVIRESDELIGSITVVGLDEKTSKFHIGYCIGSSYWHRGYTSEAFSEVIDFLFTKVGAKRIESQHDPLNINSGKVMQKCGLKYEGTLRKADWNNTGIVDAAIYAILKEDYMGH